MALQDLLSLSSEFGNKKKIGLSKERVTAMIPVIR